MNKYKINIQTKEPKESPYSGNDSGGGWAYSHGSGSGFAWGNGEGFGGGNGDSYGDGEGRNNIITNGG